MPAPLNPPAPSNSQSAAGKEKDASQNKRVSADNQSSVAKHSAPVVTLEAKTIQLETKHETAGENWFASPEWWIAGATIVLAGVTALLARYTYKLYAATVALGVEAKEASARQAGETQKALGLSKRSADIAEQALFFADRPILDPTISGGFVDPESLKILEEGESRAIVFQVFLTLKNEGRTPAIIEAFEVGIPRQGEWFSMQMERKEVHIRLSPSAAVDLKRFMDVPSGGSTPIADAVTALTEANRREIKRISPVVAGKVWYRTVHNKRYVLAFQFVKHLTWQPPSEGWSRHGTSEENYDRPDE